MTSPLLRSALLALGLTALVGCGAEPAEPAGTARLTFSVDQNVRESSNLTSPLLGPVYGAIYKAEDVTAMGPIEGAEQLVSVELSSVDLREAEVSAVSWTTPDLPPDVYVFLGFFDVNGNGEESRSPDKGDPVTLPSVNQFEILDGEQEDVVVRFSLILN